MNVAISTPNSIPSRYAPDFELPGIDNSVHHLTRYLERFRAVCVVFIDCHYPMVRSQLEWLNQVQHDLRQQGIALVGINSSTSLSAQLELRQMKTFASKHHFDFPYLHDATQEVAEGFGTEQSPQIYLIDQDYVLRFSSPIVADDQPDTSGNWLSALKHAIAQLLPKR